MRLYIAFIALLFLSAPIVNALDSESTRHSLQGLKGIQVFIEPQKPEVEQNGLRTSTIRTDVELKLRQAGIPILTLARGNAVLFITVSVLPSSNGYWPFTVTTDVSQNAVLSRDPSISLPVTSTWSVTVFGAVGKENVRDLRDYVKDQTDQFINAYLAVNPK